MKILETDRLILREMSHGDCADISRMLCDKDVMYAWEHGFSAREAHEWLGNQLTRYRRDGYGLWAVILKRTGELVGQCGLTNQDVNGETVTEIGYVFGKEFWHNGYAAEAASACKNYAFDVLNRDRVYSIIRDSNLPSQKVAERNGMTVRGVTVKHYYGFEMPHLIFCAEKSVKNDSI